MILNLRTNFEFWSLWNYHFTLYALKCKKVKLIVAKWGVNKFFHWTLNLLVQIKRYFEFICFLNFKLNLFSTNNVIRDFFGSVFTLLTRNIKWGLIKILISQPQYNQNLVHKKNRVNYTTFARGIAEQQ